MTIDFSSKSLSLEEVFFKRLFNTLLAILSWGVILGLAIAAFFKPLLVCAISAAFSLFWIFNMIYKIFFLKISI